MSNGWEDSAEAWIASVGEEGDWSRRHVLDSAMSARLAGRGFSDAIDIGCGEGRFCRIMQRWGIRTCGIDPTARLVEAARRRDPAGDYRLCGAEALEAVDRSFDLAVSYLSLIDIQDYRGAIAEAFRVLRPGGAFLIANLTSFNTAGPPDGWTREADGTRRFYIDHYLDERTQRVAWAGISVVNWHRPLSLYMSALLDAGFQLRYFAEPEPIGAEAEQAARYRRVPWFLVMEWQKPG